MGSFNAFSCITLIFEITMKGFFSVVCCSQVSFCSTAFQHDVLFVTVGFFPYTEILWLCGTDWELAQQQRGLPSQWGLRGMCSEKLQFSLQPVWRRKGCTMMCSESSCALSPSEVTALPCWWFRIRFLLLVLYTGWESKSNGTIQLLWV